MEKEVEQEAAGGLGESLSGSKRPKEKH